MYTECARDRGLVRCCSHYEWSFDQRTNVHFNSNAPSLTAAGVILRLDRTTGPETRLNSLLVVYSNIRATYVYIQCCWYKLYNVYLKGPLKYSETNDRGKPSWNLLVKVLFIFLAWLHYLAAFVIWLHFIGGYVPFFLSPEVLQHLVLSNQRRRNLLKQLKLYIFIYNRLKYIK